MTYNVSSGTLNPTIPYYVSSLLVHNNNLVTVRSLLIPWCQLCYATVVDWQVDCKVTSTSLLFYCCSTGDFTFWLSHLLRPWLNLKPNFGLSLKMRVITNFAECSIHRSLLTSPRWFVFGLAQTWRDFCSVKQTAWCRISPAVQVNFELSESWWQSFGLISFWVQTKNAFSFWLIFSPSLNLGLSDSHRWPQYIVELCQPVAGVASRQHLRSATQQLMVVPRHQLSSYGRRAFCVAGPSAWNSVPDSLQNPIIGGNSFRQSLKTFLFAMYWCIQCIRGFTTMRYINWLFTYLLTYSVSD